MPYLRVMQNMNCIYSLLLCEENYSMIYFGHYKAIDIELYILFQMVLTLLMFLY